MKNLSFLIKPASSLCNMRCKYCFYADVSDHREIKSNGIMNKETMNNLIKRALGELDEDGYVTFAFQGGEPTVAGLPYFEEFTETVNQMKRPHQHISYALQTNGVVLDDKWCEFFHKHQFLVGVSLDGYKENHDAFRIADGNKATYKKVMEGIACLRKHQVDFNILTVLSRQLARHPQKLYEFYQREQFNYIQLIPCLAGLDEKENIFSLTPQLFSDFYKKFYDLWLNEYTKGIYRSISFIDNIVLMYANQLPHQCGMLGHCSLQFVVESDGSVYPCDFYVLDEYKSGNINENGIEEIAQNEISQKFLKEERLFSPLCASCEFEQICHGNCRRMCNTYYDEKYCGYQDFLRYASPTISRIAFQFRR